MDFTDYKQYGQGPILDAISDDDLEPSLDAVENDDGSATIVSPEEMQETSQQPQGHFYENLALVYDDVLLFDTADRLIDLIEEDKIAREKRDKQQKEALERSGVTGPAPGGADFQGANKVTHPGLLSIAIDFAARTTKELLPPDGPVKSKVEEPVTPPEQDRADRISNHMNWQITRQMQEFSAEIEQMLTQLTFGGSQYIKAWRDVGLGRNRIEFVPIDDMFIPLAASNFYTAERKTHRLYLTSLEVEARMKSGLYRDVSLSEVSQFPELSQSAEVTLKAEGASDSGENEDGLREVYESFVQWDFGDGTCPYIITIDKDSRKVLSVYRNWEEHDDRKQELTWIIDFTLIPWRGPVGIGFPQIFAGLPAAITGSLRALLDSAHAQNSPSTITQKGITNVGGQTRNPTPGQNIELATKTGVPTDDIRKVIMPLTFSGPSPVLLELLGILKQEMTDTLRMSLDNISDTNQNTPVGTHLSRVEQGLVVYSSIHKRLHHSMEKLLQVLYRLNSQYLNERDEVKEAGKILATRADYQGPPSIAPVSDPNIFSEFQRLTQLQSVLQLQNQIPDLPWQKYNTANRILKLMKVPAIDEILPPPPPPPPPPADENPVIENSKLMLGMPVKALPQQDQIEHLLIHFDVLVSPLWCQNRMFAPIMLPQLLDHIRQHLAFAYQEIYIKAVQQKSGIQIEQVVNNPQVSDLASKAFVNVSLDVQRVFSAIFIKEATQRYGTDAASIIKQAFDFLDTIQAAPANNNPMIQLEQQQLQQKSLEDQRTFAQKQEQMDQQKQMNDDKIRADLIKNAEDNQTAQSIASLRAFTGHGVGTLTDGASLGSRP